MTSFSTLLGILTAFYTKPRFTRIIYAICIKRKFLPKKWLFQCFYLIIICWGRKPKNTFFFRTIFLFSKIALTTHFYVFILILREFFFFSQNDINYPLFSVFKRINISSKKPYLFLVQKKEIYAITRKKFLFTEKVDFSMIFCLFHCFHKK